MKKLKVTKLMKRQIAKYKKYFLSRTYVSHMISYLNGFSAVGIFKMPQKHLTNKRVNILWVYIIGFNDSGNKIIENTNIEMDLEEGEGLMKCLINVIKRYKEVNSDEL